MTRVHTEGLASDMRRKCVELEMKFTKLLYQQMVQ
jgi:hypothetical protein